MSTSLYTVNIGDTLTKIAAEYGLSSWKEIYYHPDNAGFRVKRPNPDRIYPGDKLRVPADPQGDNPPIRLVCSPPDTGDSELTVTPITAAILGTEDSDHFTSRDMPDHEVINLATFRRGDPSNAPTFLNAAGFKPRVGVFALRKKAFKQAIIVMLPPGYSGDGTLIAISHRLDQNHWYYEPLGYTDPLSPPLIRDMVNRMVLGRYGPQVVASKKKLALAYPVRASAKNRKGREELGLFVTDPTFAADALTEISRLCGATFRFDPASVEACGYSDGVFEFNKFLQTTRSTLTQRVVYNFDPTGMTGALAAPGTPKLQYCSGQTGDWRPGFEFMPIARWKNEAGYKRRKGRFATQHERYVYLHVECIPEYCLFLGLQFS